MATDNDGVHRIPTPQVWGIKESRIGNYGWNVEDAARTTQLSLRNFASLHMESSGIYVLPCQCGCEQRAV